MAEASDGQHLCLVSKLSGLLTKHGCEVVRDAVERNNGLVVTAYQFVKLYLLDAFERACQSNNGCFDVKAVLAAWPDQLDAAFFSDAYTTVAAPPTGGRTPNATPQRAAMAAAYHRYVGEEGVLPSDPISAVNLSNVKGYHATEMATAYDNNIRFHYVQYLKRVCRHLFRRVLLQTRPEEQWDQLPQEDRQRIELQFKAILRAVVNGEQPTCDPDVRFLYDRFAPLLGPAKPATADDKWKVWCDIRSRPLTYLAYMVNLNRVLEDGDCQLYSPLCMRTELIPKHMHLDTNGLVDLLVGEHFEADEVRHFMNFRYMAWLRPACKACIISS